MVLRMQGTGTTVTITKDFHDMLPRAQRLQVDCASNGGFRTQVLELIS
jgi:hypothetical protein